jgi:hypothetical protein
VAESHYVFNDNVTQLHIEGVMVASDRQNCECVCMVVILLGTNDMMGLEVLTDSVGCEATWSTVVALNAIGTRPVRLFELGGRTFAAGATGQRIRSTPGRGQPGCIGLHDHKEVSPIQTCQSCIQSATAALPHFASDMHDPGNQILD